jgi:hypothetical protein
MNIEKSFNLTIVAIAIIYTAFMFNFFLNMEKQHSDKSKAALSIDHKVQMVKPNTDQDAISPILTDLNEVVTEDQHDSKTESLNDRSVLSSLSEEMADHNNISKRETNRYTANRHLASRGDSL